MAIASNGKKIKSWQNVLVRNKKTDCWKLCTFLYKAGKKYVCIGYAFVEEFVAYEEYYKECIPYKGNKELYGTSESWKTNSFYT